MKTQSIKYQTIRRFLQKQGYTVVDTTKHNDTPAIKFQTATHMIVIVKNPCTDVLELTVATDTNRLVCSANRYTQKSVVEVLQSDFLSEYMTLPTVEPETAPEVDVEVVEDEVVVVDSKQLKKTLQKRAKEVRNQYGLNADNFRVSFTEKQQDKGEFTVAVGVSNEAIAIEFGEEFGTYVGTEDGTFSWTRRVRFIVGENKMTKKQTKKQTVKSFFENVAKDNDLVLGCYNPNLEVLTTKARKEVAEWISIGDYTNVVVTVRNKKYIIELSFVDGEVDIDIKTPEEYEEEYGEAYDFE